MTSSSNTTKGLYGNEINCLADRILPGTPTRWIGVFACDELPSEQELLRAQMQAGNLPIALVFNNQPASEPGQHWLAIYACHQQLKVSLLLNTAASFTLTLNFLILMHCLQPPIHCIRISRV